MTHGVAVLVPTYNEERSIASVLSTIVCAIPSGVQLLLLVSDDASTDNTMEVAKRFTKYVITNETHAGVGSVIRSGLRHIARFTGIDYVFKMDGDGQHDAARLPQMLELLSGQRADIVCCSRFHPLSLSEYEPPLDRILLNKVMSRLISEITDWKVTDAELGFMGFCFKDVCRIRDALIIDGYGLSMEIVLRLWRLDPELRYAEVPHPARDKMGVSDGLDMNYLSLSAPDRSNRLRVAYEAMLCVLADLGVNGKQLLLEPAHVYHPEYAMIE